MSLVLGVFLQWLVGLAAASFYIPYLPWITPSVGSFSPHEAAK